MTPARTEWLKIKAEALKDERRKAREDEARRQAARDADRKKQEAGKRVVVSRGRLSI
jgi:hypothetical protein